MELQSLQRMVSDWQNATFPNATTQSVLAHLREEVEELCAAPSPEECADVLMLLIGVANHEGFDLADAVWQKFLINQGRVWTVHAAGGYTKHEL